jgi:hypothetical protein
MRERGLNADAIELLACDIAARPRSAPLPDVLAQNMRKLERANGALTITFAKEASDDVEAFAAAERVCCSGIAWDLRRKPLRLTITAAAAQLDAIETLFGRSGT